MKCTCCERVEPLSVITLFPEYFVQLCPQCTNGAIGTMMTTDVFKRYCELSAKIFSAECMDGFGLVELYEAERVLKIEAHAICADIIRSMCDPGFGPVSGPKLQIQILRPEATVPRRAFNSAGYDLWPLTDGVIQPGGMVRLPLGFATSFPTDFVAVIDDKSGVGSNMVMHLAGVIDGDYRGEWGLMMYNAGREPYEFKRTKALSQFLLLRVERMDTVVVDSLDDTERGVGGFGSSGH